MASPEKALSAGHKAKPKAKSKKEKSKKKPVRHMHIERADNGGFNVRHSFDQGGPDEEPTPDTTHALGDSNALLSHVADNFGGQMPQGAGASGPAAPAQAAPQQGM